MRRFRVILIGRTLVTFDGEYVPMDATRAEDRGMIVETGVGANASFACGLAGSTTCVFVTNPLISTTTEEKKKGGEDLFKTEAVRERKSRSPSRP